jgi:hypothetical protein
MSKDKKEEKKEEKSPELKAAEAKVELEKKMGEELADILEKHNCTLDGQAELHDGTMSCHVVYVPYMVAGEKEEDKKKRAELAKEEVEKCLSGHGYKLTSFALLGSTGTRFGFKFLKKEESK